MGNWYASTTDAWLTFSWLCVVHVAIWSVAETRLPFLLLLCNQGLTMFILKIIQAWLYGHKRHFAAWQAGIV